MAVLCSDIITQSFCDLGVIQPGDTLSASLLANGQQLLRFMYASWAIEEKMMVQRENNCGPLTVNISGYSIGIGSGSGVGGPFLGNFGLTPVRLISWQHSIGVIKTGGNVISFADFNSQVKDDIGTSSRLIRHLAADAGGAFNVATRVFSIKVWPTPAAQATQAPFENLAITFWTYTDDIGTNSAASIDNMSPAWFDALHWNLAMALYPQFQRTANPEVIAANAQKSKAAIADLNASIYGLNQAA